MYYDNSFYNEDAAYDNWKRIESRVEYTGMIDDANEQVWLSKIEPRYLPDVPIFAKYHGKAQPTIILNGTEDYRARTDCIIIDNRKRILLDPIKKKCFKASFPGGGIEIGETDVAYSAEREANEEALVKVKNCKFMNIIWFLRFIPQKYTYGQASFICCAKYDGEFSGYVNPDDLDDFAKNKIWVSIPEAEKESMIGPPHVLALKRYFDWEKKKNNLHETVNNLRINNAMILY